MERTMDTINTQELVDRTEIGDLVFRLGVVLDEGRFDEMPDLFVEDATARTPGGVATGREAVIAQAKKNHRPDQHIQHLVSNVLVDVDVDGDRAKVRANLVVHFAPSEPTGADPAPHVQYILGEVYHLDAQRGADGWRLARVETIPVWMSGTRPAVPAVPAVPA
jgi:hypothetical protein